MENGRVMEPLQPLLASAEVNAVVGSVRDYAIFLLDREGTILSWNTGAQRIKGYTAEEIIGQKISRFYTPEDLARGRPWALLAEAVREGRVEDEGWRVRKDGTRFWADVVISAIPGPGGGVRGFVKVTRDLTERRKNDEQLRQSEERLRLMIGSVQEYAIFMLDPEGRVATWNTGATALKGYAASEIIGEHVSRFYIPEEATSGKAKYELGIAASTGRFEEEGWRVRKDGSRFWANVVISAIHNSDGALVGFTKVTRDMTARKRSLEETLERARQQAAVSAFGLYALGKPELQNVMDAAVETVRRTLSVQDVSVIVEGATKTAGAVAAPIHVLSDAGHLTPYGELVAAAPRPLSANDVAFLQAVANVLAAAIARARIEEQLRHAERDVVEERQNTIRANDALRERDEFISVAAHELRTPLTALQLKLQSLERKVAHDSDVPSRVQGAIRQTERLARLVDRLLDVSRVSQQRLEMADEEFDLVELLREVGEDFREPAAQAHAPLQLQLPESATGRWDRLRLEQVVVNIFSNAVKYGAGKPISVMLETGTDWVRLIVADQGIGISAQDASRLFGRFQRAASIRHYGGMGLGLYISRHIVEAHGGTISVASKPGQGSTFVVQLPRFPGARLSDGEKARA
jgi:PAS domain S-box-containing protein